VDQQEARLLLIMRSRGSRMMQSDFSTPGKRVWRDESLRQDREAR